MAETLTIGEALLGGPQSPLPNEQDDSPFERQVVSIEDALGSELPDPQRTRASQNFFERTAANVDKRRAMIKEIADAEAAGEQGFAESMGQMAGKFGAGLVMDTLGEVLVSGARGLSAITPDIIEDPAKDLASFAARQFLNTKAGQAGLNAATKGLEAWVDWKEENPRSARNIESLVNVGLLMAPIKAKKGPGVVGRAGEAATRSAAKSSAKNKAVFVEDLVRPFQSIKQKTKQVRATEERGLLRSKRASLSARDDAAARQVEKLSVSPRKSLQANHDVIQDAMRVEAKRLRRQLVASNARYSSGVFENVLDDVLVKMTTDNPAIVGNAALSAERVVNRMKKLASADDTVAGLLKARQGLDDWIRKQKSDNIFAPETENALAIAIREVRTATNDFIVQSAPTAGVKKSLRKQSNLFRAMDNIAPKAAREANNIAMRAWQKVLAVLPFRGEGNQVLALAFGVGGLGAAAQFAPFITGMLAMTGISYIAGRAVMSPSTRKALGTLLKTIDKAISKTRDGTTIQQLRLDRAAIVELIQSSDVAAEQK